MTMSFGDVNVRDSVPVIFSAQVLEEIDNKLVFGKIATKQYEREIQNKGDRVIIRGLGDVTVTEYDPTAHEAASTDSVSYERPSDSAIQLDIDQAYYYAIAFGDIKKKQIDIDIMSRYAKKAGYGLDVKVDEYIAALYDETAEAAAYVTDATCDTYSVTSTIGELWDALQGVNVDRKWIVLPSWMVLKLQLAGIVQAQKLEGELKNGFIGRVLNFDMYQSNNCYDLGGTKQHAVMAGSYDCIAFAQQIIESEMLRLEGSFSDAIRGLHVWGARVIKPKELFYADVTYADEEEI